MSETFKDASGTTKYRKSTGAGSVGDPGVLHNIIDSGTCAATQSGTWNVTNISGTVSLPTGAATAANQTTIIGHVDGIEALLTTIDADTGTILTNTNSGAVVGNGAAATAQRVTLANDSTGILGTVSTVSTVAEVSGGGVAHDAADSGKPIKFGAVAESALSGVTLVADADRTNLYAGRDGVLFTRPHTGLEDIVTGNASNTDGTSTACIAASGSGSVKTYLTHIALTNTSASNIYVEIKNGATTKLTLPVPAGGGCVVNLSVPLPGAANTAWNFDASAATTTVYCSMIGFYSAL